MANKKPKKEVKKEEEVKKPFVPKDETDPETMAYFDNLEKDQKKED